MEWQLTPYTPPAVVAAGLVAALGAVAWKRRPMMGASEFALCALAVAWHLLAAGAEFARADLDGKVFLHKVEYVGVVSVPVLWLAWTVAYTSMGHGLSRRQLAALSVIPVLTLVLAWTNEHHRLIWAQVEVAADGPWRMWHATYGPWFWAYSAYSYLVLSSSTLLVARLLVRTSRLLQGQGVLLLLGLAAPWAANIVSIARLSPIRDLDLTPFGLAVSALAVGGSFLYFRLLDIIPIAREALVGYLPDGVLVLDTHNRVIDLNPAARRLIGPLAAAAMGRPVGEVLVGWPASFAEYTEGSCAPADLALTAGEIQNVLRATRVFTRRPATEPCWPAGRDARHY